MSIKNRIQRIEDKVSPDDGIEIVVFITDGNEILHCGVRREGCPEYPCRRDACWWERENPNSKTIRVGFGDDDN